MRCEFGVFKYLARAVRHFLFDEYLVLKYLTSGSSEVAGIVCPSRYRKGV